MAGELLESRYLLATDLASITGAVFIDLNNDGPSPGDPPVLVDSFDDVVGPGSPGASGVEVELFRDDGLDPGQFDPSDSLVDTVQTDLVTGIYRFDGLEVGNYFVRQAAVGGLNAPSHIQPVLVTVDQADGERTALIDDFSDVDSFNFEIVSPTPSAVDFQSSLSGTIGGERDAQLTTDPGSMGGARIRFSLTAGSGDGVAVDTVFGDGEALLQYDGEDGEISLNPLGLNNISLGGGTADEPLAGGGGILLNTRFAVTIDESFEIRVYTSDTEVSVATISAPGTAEFEELFVPFSAFTAQPSGGANFNDVGAIELVLNQDNEDTVIEVSLIEARRTDVFTLDLPNIQPLTLGGTLFLDISGRVTGIPEALNDGLLDIDSSQFGDSVEVRLYDVTGNLLPFDPGDSLSFNDSPIGTTTSRLDRYRFNNLDPGEYRVVIPASQFADNTGSSNPNGVLFGHASSLFTTVAPDPDDDLDNDDNGTQAIAGGAIISAPVTLASQSEPIDDDDDDPNTNTTVDFGLIPLADLRATTPIEFSFGDFREGDTASFDVTIENLGPADALEIIIVGSLSSGLSFDVPGNIGFPDIFADGAFPFGSLAAGESISFTLSVNLDSPGSQGASVEVSTLAAVDTIETNNSSGASFEIIPIMAPEFADLQISHDVSDATAIPGSLLTYTSVVTNVGNVAASEVNYTSTLPDGVTFVSGTGPNGEELFDFDDDGVVTFAKGNLDVDDSFTMVINAVVDSGASGVQANDVSVAWQFFDSVFGEDGSGSTEASASTNVELANSTVSGTVYVDINNNGIQEENEPGIPSVELNLFPQGIGVDVPFVATTDENGAYLFEDLPAGSYDLLQIQPVDFRDGIETIGVGGGDGISVDDNRFSNLTFGSDETATNFNFGELAGSATLSIETTRNASEPDVNGEFTIRLDNALATDTTVNLEYIPNTVEDEDIFPIDLEVTIPAGETSVIIPVIVRDDDIVEEVESFTLEFASRGFGVICAAPIGQAPICPDPSDLFRIANGFQEDPNASSAEMLVLSDDMTVADGRLDLLEDGPAQSIDVRTLFTSDNFLSSPDTGTTELLTLVVEDFIATFTPMPDAFGSNTFQFSLIDSEGIPTGEVATVTVNVTPANDPPVAIDDSLTLTPSQLIDDGSFAISIADLLANDAVGPPNETEMAQLILTDPTTESGLDIRIENELLIVSTNSATPGFNELNDTFSYRMSDGEFTSEASVAIEFLGGVTGQVTCDSDSGSSLFGTRVFVDRDGDRRHDSDEPFDTADSSGSFNVFSSLSGSEVLAAAIPSSCQAVAQKPGITQSTVDLGLVARSVAAGDFTSTGRDLLVAVDFDDKILRLAEFDGNYSVAETIDVDRRPQMIVHRDIGTQTTINAVASIGVLETQDNVVNSIAGGISVSQGSSANYIDFQSGSGTIDLLIEDFDGDQVFDVGTVSFRSSTLQVHLAANGFSPVIVAGDLGQVVAIASGDLNGDGNADLVTGSVGYDSGLAGTPDIGSMTIHLGNGDGTFRPTASNPILAGDVVALSVGALNETEDAIAVFSTGGGGGVNVHQLIDNELLLLSSIDSLNDISDLQLGDFDGDGNIDLATVSLQGNAAEIFLGDGSGGFASLQTISVLTPIDVMAADIDNSGRDDLVILNLFGSPDRLPSALTIVKTDVAEVLASEISGESVDIVFSGNSSLQTLDVSADGRVSALDALQVMNQIQRQSTSAEGELVAADTKTASLRDRTDVDRNGVTTARDALLIINHISRTRADQFDEVLTIQAVPEIETTILGKREDLVDEALSGLF
ncbi:SdrD B-like domain-containing protein [Rubripirellula obstinata]|uniref:SdrD B-like domain-containing protein n=1 Tax=Rubripirellula obstinata TaxID=406547 RepID=UPI00082E5760|nr:SdrD B-like domain-containing protein [Rubripirellula obstinata]